MSNHDHAHAPDCGSTLNGRHACSCGADAANAALASARERESWGDRIPPRHLWGRWWWAKPAGNPDTDAEPVYVDASGGFDWGLRDMRVGDPSITFLHPIAQAWSDECAGCAHEHCDDSMRCRLCSRGKNDLFVALSANAESRSRPDATTKCLIPRRVLEALESASEALKDLGACDDPNCQDDNCNHALTKVRDVLASITPSPAAQGGKGEG